MFRFDTVAHLFFSVTPALNNMERSGMLFNGWNATRHLSQTTKLLNTNSAQNKQQNF